MSPESLSAGEGAAADSPRPPYQFWSPGWRHSGIAAEYRNGFIAFTFFLFVFIIFAESSYGLTGSGEKGPQKGAMAEVPNTADDHRAKGIFVEKNIKIEFLPEPLNDNGNDGGNDAVNAVREIVEGEYARIGFRITDATTGAPVSPLKPAVWIDHIKAPEGEAGPEPVACRDKVKTYIKGSLASRPDIDLNSYFVLSLNEDASISVIDPIVGMTGITQLYALILLKKPGEDWVMGGDDRRLFVTMPQASQVAVVNTDNFTVIENIDAGINPVRIVLQPDAKYLWVGNDSQEAEESGVSVIDASTLRVSARIPTGAGHHEIAFSPDSLFAFVTNRDEGTVSVIDTQRLVKIRDLKTGERPAALAVSGLSRAVYIVHEGDGKIVVVDAEKQTVSGQLTLHTGLNAVRFAPGGRWGFITNGARNEVLVLDAASDRIIHTAGTIDGPDRISFTGRFAYIRSGSSADLNVVQLSGIGKDGPLPLLRISGGQRPPGESRLTSVADAVVAAGEYDTVLITNPADGLIYYYMEGMEAPMGNFRSYNRIPRAARVVDRSIRESERGFYSAKVRVPESGKYEVAFLLDSPRIVHCFEFSAAPAAGTKEKGDGSSVRMTFLSRENTVRGGDEFILRFSLSKASGRRPVSGISDITVLATRTPGAWKGRFKAVPAGEGQYELRLSVPAPGVYYLFFASSSLKLGYTRLPYFVLRAEGSAGQ